MIQITIVIPYFNYSYFDFCLNSLANQTDKRFKVFVGDDNAPIHPSDLIAKYKKNIDIDYVKFSTNIGQKSLTKHWCRCLEYVKTEWFMILGDDDMLSANAIEAFYNIVLSDNSGNRNVLRYNTQIVDDKNNKISPLYDYSHITDSLDFQYLRALKRVRSSLGEYVFKKESYLKHGVRDYPKAFYSDNMMVLEYSELSVIEPIKNATVFIRVTNESQSGNPDNESWMTIAAYEFYWDLLSNYSVYIKREHKYFYFNLIYSGVLNKEIAVNTLSFLKCANKELNVFQTVKLYFRMLKYLIFHFPIENR